MNKFLNKVLYIKDEAMLNEVRQLLVVIKNEVAVCDSEYHDNDIMTLGRCPKCLIGT